MLGQLREQCSTAIKNARYAARNRKIRTFFVSFPKTGRTWLRVMVGKALAETYGFPDERVLDTYKISQRARYGPFKFSHGNRRHLLDDGPFNTLVFDEQLYTDKRIVFLTRDIRDTLVSYYFQQAKREKLYQGSMSEFLRDPCHGAQKIIKFYTLWYEHRDVPADFFHVTYEQLRSHGPQTMASVLSFMGLEGDLQALAKRVIDYASFENMKKMERSQQFDRKVMKPGDPGDAESFKVRKGKVGGFDEYLDAQDQAYLEEVIASQGNTQCPWYLTAANKFTKTV